MATFKKGDTVKVNATVPQGPIESMRMDEDGNVSYLFSWVDSEEVTQTRWFAEIELVAV